MSELPRDRISIAILALGGQGGGVLAEWIQEVARHHGWLAQGTSVPGVAQRTGSTVYYVELAKQDGDRRPVMAQMPLPGDVDIVLASELMETGRALLRGFSSADRTTLIGSTHRIFAISEKSAMGDGRKSSERIIEAAGERSKRFIGFDMDAATNRAGSMISSVLFGALAGSGALPFTRASFEEVIRAGGKAVPSNLKGFEEGFVAAQGAITMPVEDVVALPVPTTAAGQRLADRVAENLPQPARANALHGVARMMDYQDAAYADLYLDRLEAVARLDVAPFLLSAETARHLALWMSYEDTIRVADLKTRASRVARVRDEVRVKGDQLLGVTEFMHPRLQEVCETLPAPIGRAILGRPGLSKQLERFFKKGRHVETTSLRWFLILRALTAMRGMRRKSLRFVEEQERISDWLRRVEDAAPRDNALAVELARSQRLVKGYGDTFERGLRNFQTVTSLYEAQPPEVRSGAQVKRWCDLALADDAGTALAAAERGAA